MFEGTKVDIPEWVTIQSSELGQNYLIGRVITVWHNMAKVQFFGPDGPHIGIYTILKHQIETITDKDWFEYYERHEKAMGFAIVHFGFEMSNGNVKWALNPTHYLLGLQEHSVGDHTNGTPIFSSDYGTVFPTKEEAETMFANMHPKCNQGWMVMPIAQLNMIVEEGFYKPS